LLVIVAFCVARRRLRGLGGDEVRDGPVRPGSAGDRDGGVDALLAPGGDWLTVARPVEHLGGVGRVDDREQRVGAATHVDWER